MRINKLFSNYGICSRKETNKLIEEKRVLVNGKLCVLGQWVTENDEILLDGKKIKEESKIYIAFNKPIGITCTAENEVEDNIIEFINYPKYIFPVGRLDKNSQGLIIMTNDGDLANKILESDNMHEKEYIVQVDKDFDSMFIEKISLGVNITAKETSGIKRINDNFGIYKELNKGKNNESLIKLDSIKNSKKYGKSVIKTRPCKVSKINDNTFNIILTQGMNRQIRKMCAAFGYKVNKLERIRILNIKIDDLEIGKWRYLSEDEVELLKKI